jgi:hypothetical protein
MKYDEEHQRLAIFDINTVSIYQLNNELNDIHLLNYKII